MAVSRLGLVLLAAAAAGFGPSESRAHAKYIPYEAPASARDAATGTYPPPPRLNIDPDGVTISGISSGADFAVQYHVAYSALVRGVGVFAGQPYHCAVTRFPLDVLQPPNPSVPVCDGCPPNRTLIYDHCKNHPQWVEVTRLKAYAAAQAAAGAIDDPSAHLPWARVYLYHGTKDPCYLNGSMVQTEAFYAQYLRDPAAQTRFKRDVPSLHCIPTDGYGTACGVEGLPHGIEDCGYEGTADALQHLYNDSLVAPTSPPVEGNLVPFDQTRYMGPGPSGDASSARFPGLWDHGWIYVPTACRGSGGSDKGKGAATAARCRLHVFFHGCGMAYASPVGPSGAHDVFGYTYIEHAGFRGWAEANNIVVVYPQMGGFKNGTLQERIFCWDSYAQTGADYALQSGLQMATVRRIMRAVAGF